jgi:hypothetical protein
MAANLSPSNPSSAPDTELLRQTTRENGLVPEEIAVKRLLQSLKPVADQCGRAVPIAMW